MLKSVGSTRAFSATLPASGVFEAIVEEEQELKQLYAPIQQRIAADTGSMARLAGDTNAACLELV